MLIRGITVRLYEKVDLEQRDGFNRTITKENPVDVENVLIEPLSAEEQREEMNLTGRKAIYRLCIPKGDAHAWTDCRVDFFEKSWRVIGESMEWIGDLLPLDWNRKIKVERIDGKAI